MGAQNFTQGSGKDGVTGAGTQAVQGLEALTNAYIQLATQVMERAAQNVQTLASVKNPAELPNVCTHLTRSNIEFAMSEGRKLMDLVTTLAGKTAPGLAGAANPLQTFASSMQNLTNMFKL